MTIPDQHTPRRRTTPLRPRNDPYRLATFRAPLTPRVVLPPTESFDPRNEPRSFEWAELRDPEVIVGGFAMFVAMVAIVVIVLLSSVT